MEISTVINTHNEEKNLRRCLDSVKDFGDEIIVVDMYSTDKTVEIAKKYKAEVFFHEFIRFVEPARNFAIEKASGDWILLIDADEELTPSLKIKLKRIVKENKGDYVEIPRKNVIFGKWIKYSRWWPDYLTRFFKKGKVRYSDKIHEPPVANGKEIKLEAREENAILHHNFQSVFQFIDRLNRYTDIQAEKMLTEKYVFDWKDLIRKPAGEFFSRFFFGEGYKDGLHGLALALLQSFQELVLYLKLWEKEGFTQSEIKEWDQVSEKAIKDFWYWQQKKTTNPLSKILYKIKSKI